MSSNLDLFLAHKQPFYETSVIWGGGTLPLRECHYLSDELPPLEHISSVRTLVFKGDSVLVLKNRDGQHILPGGRREQNETLQETLHREMKEETGWTVRIGDLLGFVHFRHLAPKPPGYIHPYPDFFQIIYWSEAQDHVPDAKDLGDYEAEVEFYPLDQVRAFDIDTYGQTYLKVGLRCRRREQ